MIPRAECPAEFPPLNTQFGRRALPRRGGNIREAPFAFLSKPFADAQRNAEVDLKFLSARATSLKIGAPLLEDWENIRIPLAVGKSGKEVTAGELLKQLQDSGRKALASSSKPLALDDWEKIRLPSRNGKEMTAGELVKQLQDSGRRALESSSKPIALDQLEVVKNFQKKLPPALSHLQKTFPDAIPSHPKADGENTQPKWRTQKVFPPPPPQPQAHEEVEQPWPEGPLPFAFTLPSNDKEDVNPFWAFPAREKGETIPFWAPGGHQEVSRGEGRNIWQQPGFSRDTPPLLKPFDGKQFISFAEWNKAVKERRWKLLVADSFRDLQRQSGSASGQGMDVAPLGVPEVLEVLARTSKEVMETLGVNPVVSARVSSALQKCKDASQRLAGSAEDAQPLPLEHRLAAVMDSTGYQHKDDGLNSVGEILTRCQLALAGTSKWELQRQKTGRRNVAIVTTASLPWMTGTAVNPLLRAAYLAELGNQDVTLMVPWLSKEDQEAVYPGNITFETPAEQETYVRDWLKQRIGITPLFKISFYPGKFSRDKRSILAVGDISALVPDEEADIAVLEEPEHLTWYYHGKRWTDKFQHVVGIIHTNYLEYVKREKNGKLQAAALEQFNNWVARIHCHKVVRLSGATQNFPKSTICNVHGVGVKFLDIGDSVARQLAEGEKPFSKGAYYLGKMVWSKGYRELVDLLAENYSSLGASLKVDVFGSGEDSDDVRREAESKGLRMQFHKGRDHADSSLHGFKVFINPSLSDVVCTTTAEALAMGKIVVCADHPSNDFFRSFPNCLVYRSTDEFVAKVQQAMSIEPKPLSAEEREMLTWEAATLRFLQSAGLEQLSVSQSGSTVSQSRLLDVEPAPAHQPREYEGMPHNSEVDPDTTGVRKVKSWDNLQSMGRFGGKSATRKARGAPASLSMSLLTSDKNDLLERFLSFSHFVAAGVVPARIMGGAAPGSLRIGEQQSKELGLPHPWVQRPTYGW